MTTANYFSSLATQLQRRAARAVLSQMGIRSQPLHDHLRGLFEHAPGFGGSFLADPVFEAMFGWEPAQETMTDLSGKLLDARLVDAMDEPPEGYKDNAFSRKANPYRHQLHSWKLLQQQPPRSVVVTSGTGSGKTECFLVPILDDLVRQLGGSGRIVGTQALFLYPLNALINSQRDRLRAWTSNFKGRVRFCLYNGDTPDQVPAHTQQEHPEEVLSRRELREEPPPMLVTNATMLEYMLVRADDRPIIDASYGRLRWIVLDEAHTYVGSQAAEIALLLRRVLHAFGVRPEQVRFVATSATIGDSPETGEDLAKFLADLAGVPVTQVSVVPGRRLVPTLSEEYEAGNQPVPTRSALEAMVPEQRFAALASSARVRVLRRSLADRAIRLSSIGATLYGRDSPGSVSESEARTTLELLDAMTSAVDGDQSFLPLRGHLFHRTQGGLWACANSACQGRFETPLDSLPWPFGRVFLERRESCDTCGAPVFELVLCSSCGAEFMAAEESRLDGQWFLEPRAFERDRDEFQQEFEELTDEEESTGSDEGQFGDGRPRMLTKPSCRDAMEIGLDPRDRQILDQPGKGLPLGLLLPEYDVFTCPRCGTAERFPQETFRPARVGAPFFLGVSIPTLLEHNPSGEGKAAEGH